MAGKKNSESDNKEFWVDVSKKYYNHSEASVDLNIDRATIRKYMNLFGLSFLSKGTKNIEGLTMGRIKDVIITCGGIKPAASFLGVDPGQIHWRLYSSGTSLGEIMKEYQQKIAPEQKLQETISGDCIITADYHIPFVSLKWVNRVVEIGKIEGIKQLLIAGDFFDFDRLSFWAKVANAEDMTVPLEDELALASMVLEELESQYDTIYFVGGNHWSRLLKNITFSVSSRRLLGLVDRANDSRYRLNEYFHWIMIDDKVRVTHPGKARKMDYTLARDLSSIFPNYWMVVAHRHRVNEGFTPDGRPQLEIGWMGDTDRMRYVQHVDSTYYRWINGFAIYRNGKLHNLTEYNYDWTEIDNKKEEVR